MNRSETDTQKNSHNYTKSDSYKKSHPSVVFINGLNRNKWDWTVSQNSVDGQATVCIGHLAVEGIGSRSGVGIVQKANAGNRYLEAEQAAFEEAARKFGWEEPALQAGVGDAIEKPISVTKIKSPSTPKERASELKKAYNMRTTGQFLAFVRLSDPSIQNFNDITESVIDSVHAHAESKPEVFSGFNPSEHG